MKTEDRCKLARIALAEMADMSIRKIPRFAILADRTDLNLDGNAYNLDSPSLVIGSPEMVLQYVFKGTFRLYDVTGESFILSDPCCIFDRNLARAFLASLEGVEVGRNMPA